MRSSWFRRGAVAATLLVPSLAAAQGVVVEHDDVACIVAGEYARINACFRPAAGIARARVYFRPETLPTWYYVEMASDAPCHAGVLPKPSKALIDKKVLYYVEAFDRASASGQTAEFAPIVVASAEECRKKGIVAPLSATGPAAVFPFMPAGFGGGAAISTGVVLGGVAAAAGITAGAIALGGDDDPGTPTTTLGGGGRPETPTPPTTAPPVTAPPVSRPDALLLACTATPRNGDAPLRVAFTSHPTGGTGVYEYSWSFADGGTSANPNPSHTYLAPGVYPATVTVTSGVFVAACTRDITVTAPPTPVPSPSASPSASPSPSPSPSASPSPSPSPSASPSPSPSPSPITFTLNVNLTGSGTGTVTGPGINCPGDCTETYLAGTIVNLTATPASPPPTVFKQWLGDCTGTSPTCALTMTANKNVTAQFELIRTLSINAGGPGSDIDGSVVSNPAGINCSWTANVPCVASAPFVNGVTVTLTVSTAGLTIQWGGACAGTTGNVCTLLMDADKAVTIETLRTFNRGSAVEERLSWTTQLDVAGAAGQVAVNGGELTSVRAGRQEMSASVRGPVLVEATLARAGGRAGTWRFEFGGRRGFKPGSLRVVVGRVALVTPDSVTFALDGKAGERVVFTFEADR